MLSRGFFEVLKSFSKFRVLAAIAVELLSSSFRTLANLALALVDLALDPA